MLLWLLVVSPAAVSWGAGELSVELMTGYNLVVDSNVTAPSTYAPNSAYIGAEICNIGDDSLAEVMAHVGDYAGNNPGIFPVWDSSVSPPFPDIDTTGDYSLTIEAGDSGTADGSRYLGTLNAGDCRMVYWLFSYPQCVNIDPDGDGIYASQAPPCDISITGGIKPDDDVSLDYDVWATTSTPAVADASGSRDFTMRNEISAAANKIWPNTTSKVPNEYLAAIESVLGWGTLGPDGQPLDDLNNVYPGQRLITTEGIWYDLGNVGHGFDNDGDLVPDQNAWLQPVGDPGSFDADCFRLVNVYGIIIVKLKTGGELLIPFQNQLYFENIPDNTGVVGLVYYQYVATTGACSAALTPYQEAASGFDNEKFSADYGLSFGLESRGFPVDSFPTKTVDLASAATGATLTYTVAADNSPSGADTGVNLGAPEFGVPLAIRETIPAGTTFVAGSADDLPVGNLVAPSGTGTYIQGYTDGDDNLDSCTINFDITASEFVTLYSDNDGANWSTTEPVAVTDIQWVLSTTIALDGGHDGADCVAPDGAYDDGTIETSLPAGKIATVHFQVTVDANPGPVVCNTATIVFGSSTEGAPDEACTLITGNNTLSGTVFADDGESTGSIYGNGVQDGSEPGIGSATNGVDVTIYYDFNGDGELDAGDIEYASTSADVNGDYSFTSLPDGPFLVVVKKYDGATSDGTDNAVNDFSTGYGNTTFDPGLPLTTDQGVLVMSEDLTTVTLAVNIDLDGSDSTGQTLNTVDFGFAEPLRLTKGVAGNPDANTNGTTDGFPDGSADTQIDEGDVFNYTLTLENRLPTGGVQGATGCEYTVWGQNYTNGSPANKAFTDPGNAFDASSPNRTVASAPVIGGGLFFITANGFGIADQAGSITKVEALSFGYFDQQLTDDFLELSLTYNGSTETATVTTAMIDSYVGEPADLKPNSAISWDITDLEPTGAAPGSWDWNDDFSLIDFKINPSKAAGADDKMFYLDAVGIRITTDAACEANASSTLSPVPLQDSYDASRFTFLSADPPATSVDTTGGVIQWDDVGPILPGTSETVIVTVRANNVSGSVTGSCVSPDACNTAQTNYLTNNVYYEDGRQANDDYDEIAVDLLGKSEVHGTVWSDANNNGWPIEAGEAGLPNVTVSLFACMRVDGVTLETSTAGKTCAAQVKDNYWAEIATTTTTVDDPATAGVDEGGLYEFLGLDTGYYMVEVGDTDGLLSSGTGGNSAPFSMTQTAEPDDDMSATAGSADAPTQVTYNNTWGNIDFLLSNFNILTATLGTEEAINGVDFGYYSANATIFGNVWWDIDGDATTDAGEDGLSGFTVDLYDDTDGDGAPDGSPIATTTTDADGNYSFSGLAADDYVVVVIPPTLLDKAWVETVESTGGTTDLNNQIPMTLIAGQISGSHTFGFTQEDTADIGDTIYLDLDGDGFQDASEDGIPNITVWLYEDIDRDGTIDDGVDSLIATDVTDASGNFLFEDYASGSYIVVVDTSDPDFPTGVVPTGDPDLNTGAIGDLVYFDADGDGALDVGEVGISNVVVTLYDDADGDGTIDAGEPLIASTVTNPDGFYLFNGLNAGDFVVNVDTSTLPDTSLAQTTAASALAVTLMSGTDSVLTADAGFSLATDYALGGRLWHDVDNDGVQDPGEVGLSGISLTITDGTGTGCSPSCTAITDESGFWIVSGLTNGTFTVDVTDPDLPRDFILSTGSTDPRTPTVASADLMNVDFGYYFNPASGTSPTGIISGTVFLDADGDLAYDAGEALDGTIGNVVNLIDDEGNIISSTIASAADGTYSFNGVFIGTYTVEVVDDYGTNYSTIFLAAPNNFPNLNVIYHESVETIPDNQSSVSVDGVHDDLNQDFGYHRFTGSIGDTVYQDVNENADQDLGEPGIDGVTVVLELCGWTDSNSDGLFESTEVGSCTAVDSAVTTANDPLTAEDESGKYLFANLDEPGVGEYYVVKVDASTLPGTTQTLVGDPDTDGVPCTLLPSPDVDGDEFPPPGVCDSWQLVQGFAADANYLGADFGYLITGAGFAAIGDHVWIDTDGDGALDSGETGVAYVTVWFDSDNDGAVDATETAVETNSEGYYVFTDLPDGTYTNLKVYTGDADWPTGLPTVPTYEVRSANTDLDSDVDVVIAAGVVTSIVDGDAGTSDTCVTTCDLEIDFGYQYGGTNTVSGTICTDDGGADGFCGATATTYSGVDTANFESPISGVQVGFYLWTDDGDNNAWDDITGALDGGDTFTFLGSTTTDGNGDYSISNIPDNAVVVFSMSETQNLLLNTDGTGSSVEDANVITDELYDGTTTYDGNTVTVLVRQALRLGGDLDNVVQDLDFAFDGTLGGSIANDFGDLPLEYVNTLLADGGARHLVTGTSIHLGLGVTDEIDGTEDASASADSNDDGVSSPPAVFQRGTTVSVTVTASADGWLAGWIDWNEDKDFNDADEFYVNQAVTAGANIVSFDIPLSLTAGTTPTFYTRYRVYPERPLLTASSGAALSATFRPLEGEVEDYEWNRAVTAAVVTSLTARQIDGSVALEWSTASEIGTAGFYLFRWNPQTSSYVGVNQQILPALMGSPQGGNYRYIDRSAILGTDYWYVLMEIEAPGKSRTFGPFQVNSDRPVVDGVIGLEKGEYETAENVFDRLISEPGVEGYWKAPHELRRPQTAVDGESAKGASKKKVTLGAKIAVRDTGIYFVSVEDIVEAGFEVDPKWLASSMNLYAFTNLGETVAFHAAPDQSGVLFYGQASDSIFAAENVYWLGDSTRNSPRMKVRSERAQGQPSGNETFLQHIHFEEDRFPATALFSDPDQSFWLWDYVVAGNSVKSFTFNTDGLAPFGDDVAMTIRLMGATDTDAELDHHAEIRVNGTLISEAIWDGSVGREVHVDVDSDVLVDGTNTMEISGVLDSGAPYSIFYLDSFEVSYQSLYHARGNQLKFSSENHEAIVVSGFTRPDIMVFDITDPLTPVVIDADAVPAGDGYGVNIWPKYPDKTYIAVAADAVLRPGAIKPDNPSDLRNKKNSGEYLVITTSDLEDTAASLADEHLDLTSQVVDIEDIWDEFNFGVSSPYALKSFLAYAWDNWNDPPRYVVLAGDGSYDYKDHMGMGGNLIPTLMVATPHGLFPSDSLLADVDSSGRAPELAIGRLPAANDADLAVMIEKIRARELAAGSEWLNTVVMLADDPDKAGNFPVDSDQLSTFVPLSSPLNRIYLSDMGVSEARNLLVGEINLGVGFVSYIGHGGMDRFASEGLLRSADVAALTNGDSPTVVMAMTCVSGNFSLPSFPCISELLMRSDLGGAVATWSPTGMSENGLAAILAEEFLINAYDEMHPRIGDVIREAASAYADGGYPTYMLDIYTLLGDPAMTLR